MPASVDIEGVWLHTASALSDYLILSQNAQVETYGHPTTFQFTFPFLPAEDVAALRDRVSHNVEVRRYAGGRLRAVSRNGLHVQMLRDQRGRKAWGVVHDLEVVEARDVPFAESVTFTFTQVTQDEEV